jgi:hypothetical protein
MRGRAQRVPAGGRDALRPHGGPDPAPDGGADRPDRNAAGIRLSPVAWLEGLVVFVLAAAVRVPGLAEGALHDELYTFLAARGLTSDGTFSLVAGGAPYTRASAFTRLVAGFLDALGPSLVVGRLPALIAGAMTAALLFLWLRFAGQRWAAWIAAGLVAVDPVLIQLSQVVRFYTFQHLLFLLGCVLVYALAVGDRRPAPRAGLALAALASFAAAVHLQVISVIGLAGVALYAGIEAAPAVARAAERGPIRRALAWGIPAAVAVGVALFVGLGGLDYLVEMGTYADLWAQNRVDNLRFYYAELHASYAVALSLLPALLLLAVLRAPRAAALAGAVVVVGLVVHSLLAWKAVRYIAYLLPFFFAVVALGTVHAAPALVGLTRAAMDRLPGGPRRGGVSLRVVPVAVTAVVLLVAAVGNRAFLQTARLLGRDHARAFPLMHTADGPVAWPPFAASVDTLLGPWTVVASTEDLKAIFYLGRLDFAVSRDHLHTRAGVLPEFSLDRRVNAPVVSTPESMAAIMGCHEEGIFVAQRTSLGRSPTSSRGVAAYVATVADSVPVRRSWGIKAYRWTTPADQLRSDCETVIPGGASGRGARPPRPPSADTASFAPPGGTR